MIYKKNFCNFILEAENRKSQIEAFGAFEFGDIIEYSFSIERKKALCNPRIEFHNAHTGEKYVLNFTFSDMTKEYEKYFLILETKMLCSECGLFFASLEYEIGGEEFSEPFQLTVYKKGFKTPDWLKGGLVYQIFPDRFFHEGEYIKREGSIIDKNWDDTHIQHSNIRGGYVKNNQFFGGNLRGITKKLDYISSLGVSAIYLCPIFESKSNHRYDTVDYMKIDTILGSEDDFKELCKKAKTKGIGIILDGVFNHTGNESIYFKDALNNENSPYRQWYKFNNSETGYECWWNIPILPRVDCDNESYQNYILGENGVIEKWLKAGSAGYRLDVADELSDDFIKKLRKKVKSENENNIVIGEVWEDASNKISYGNRRKYLSGTELDSVMNYPLREGIIEFLKTENPDLLSHTVENICEKYPKCVRDVLLNFLGTHDTARIINILSEDYPADKTNDEIENAIISKEDKEKANCLLKSALILLFTLPGVPCIFYGDEVGLEGWWDPFNRKPFPWGKEDTDLLNFTRTLSSVRKSNKVYIDGEYCTLYCKNSVFAFSRTKDGECISTVVNMGETKFALSCKYKSLISGKTLDGIKPKSADILFGKVYFDNT